MVRLQVHLKTEQLSRLRHLAEAQGRSISELAREAIRFYLAQQEGDPWDLMVGISASEHGEGSLHHDC